MKLFFQGLTYAVIAVALALFSQWPLYHAAPQDMAMVRLTFSHNGDRVVPCRTLTPKERAALPQNMRRATQCSRERVPVVVELAIDGEVLLSRSLPPTGLGKDGASVLYQGFWVPAGEHQLAVRLRDTTRQEGFDWTLDERVTLGVHDNLVIDFKEGEGLWIRTAGKGQASS